MYAWLHRAQGARIAAAVGCAAAAVLFAPSAHALFPEDGFADVARATMPAYVDIAVSRRAGGPPVRRDLPGSGLFDEFFNDFFGNAPEDQGGRRVSTIGAGFLIDPSGVVITNYHVVADAGEVAVILQNGDRLPAEVLGVDERADLAALKVDTDDNLPFLRWGDSDTADVGDWSLAIGNPFGLGSTLTLGIISGRARNINAGPYVDFIQTDASINRGNSGGPLLNLDGEVIGINTAIFSPNGASIGIGFAIPSNVARPIVDQLIEYGRPRRGWLGVRIQGVTDSVAERLGMSEAVGALISAVAPDGPAEAGGLRRGDVVLVLDGQDIADVRALPRVVAAVEIDSVVDVEVWRDRRRRTLRVKVGELTEVAVARLTQVPELEIAPPPEAGGRLDALGLRVAGITPELRDRYGLAPGTDGVVVTGVRESGPAAARNIEAGDVVVAVGEQRVLTPADMERLLAAASAERRSSVQVMLQRGDRLRWVVLRLG